MEKEEEDKERNKERHTKKTREGEQGEGKDSLGFCRHFGSRPSLHHLISHFLFNETPEERRIKRINKQTKINDEYVT